MTHTHTLTQNHQNHFSDSKFVSWTNRCTYSTKKNLYEKNKFGDKGYIKRPKTNFGLNWVKICGLRPHQHSFIGWTLQRQKQKQKQRIQVFPICIEIKSVLSVDKNGMWRYESVYMNSGLFLAILYDACPWNFQNKKPVHTYIISLSDNGHWKLYY